MWGEFEDAASEWEEFDRGSVAGGRVLKLGLKGSEPSQAEPRALRYWGDSPLGRVVLSFELSHLIGSGFEIA